MEIHFVSDKLHCALW